MDWCGHVVDCLSFQRMLWGVGARLYFWGLRLRLARHHCACVVVGVGVYYRRGPGALVVSVHDLRSVCVVEFSGH